MLVTARPGGGPDPLVHLGAVEATQHEIKVRLCQRNPLPSEHPGNELGDLTLVVALQGHGEAWWVPCGGGWV